MIKYSVKFIRIICILFIGLSFSSCVGHAILVSINNCSDDVYKLKFKLKDIVQENSELYNTDCFLTASFKSIEEIDYHTLKWKEVTWEENIKGREFCEIDLKPGETIMLSNASKTMANYESKNFDYVEITNLKTNAKIAIESKMMRNIVQIREAGFTENFKIPGIEKRTYAYLNLN